MVFEYWAIMDNVTAGEEEGSAPLGNSCGTG